MNKKLKYSLIGIGTGAVVAAGITTAVVILKNPTVIKDNNKFPNINWPGGNDNSENNKPPINKIVPLTSDEVVSNFGENGIWSNKTFITSNDLKQYNAISYNAFDNLTKQLDYIEIDQNKKIVDNNNIIFQQENSNFKLNWNNINEIRIKTNPISNDIFFVEHSGLVYYKITSVLFDNIYLPISLSSKTKVIDITFPSQNDNFPKDSLARIPDNFYSTFNKNNNIRSINFSNVQNPEINISKISPTLVVDIGMNAFKDCQVLEKNLYLVMYEKWYSFLSPFSIDEFAFSNTNLESICVFSNSFIVDFNNGSFCNNKNLKNVFISNQSWLTSIKDYCFANNNPSFSFYLSPEYVDVPTITTPIKQEFSFGNYLFHNDVKYSNLSLNFKMSEFDNSQLSLSFALNSLSNLNLLNPSSFQLNYYFYYINNLLPEEVKMLSDFIKSNYQNSGLQPELLNSLKILPYF